MQNLQLHRQGEGGVETSGFFLPYFELQRWVIESINESIVTQSVKQRSVHCRVSQSRQVFNILREFLEGLTVPAVTVAQFNAELLLLLSGTVSPMQLFRQLVKSGVFGISQQEGGQAR